jgi:hypothetical protein
MSTALGGAPASPGRPREDGSWRWTAKASPRWSMKPPLAPRALSALPLGLAFVLALGACGGEGGEDPDAGPIPSAFPPPGADFVFAVIGDYGDTSDTRDGSTDVQRVEALVEGWAPRFIATVGDNDYSDGQYAGTFEGLDLGVGQYFHEWIGDYRGDRGPGAAENRFFPAVGDHDYGDDCDNPRLADYLAYFSLPEGPEDETYYAFRSGPVEIFVLDTIIDCHRDAGAKMERQRAWLEASARASDAAFQIVLAHNPPFSSGTRHGSFERMQWDYGAWGIDLVISGDDHIYERVERGGVTYLVNGLGGVEAHPVGRPIEGSVVQFAEEFGALGVAVRETSLEVDFVDVEGRVIDRFTLGEVALPPTLDPNAPPVTEGSWYRPGPSTSWQWQLQGTLNASYDVEVYDVDLFDTDAATIASLQAAGRRVICYFSAGSYEGWRPDAGEFGVEDRGSTLDGFDDERWLDIRSTNVARIMRGRLDLAVERGCDGVEPDNVDGFTNGSGFPLTATDQLAFNRFLANEAHRRGLSVALKNDLDQIPELVAYFDFSVNEQCHEFDECDALAPFTAAGKAVFVAEYLPRFVREGPDREAMCAASRAADLRTLVLPLDLDDSFRISCDP